MQFNSTLNTPHLAPRNNIGQVMRQVIYALIPGTAIAIGFFGWGLLINLFLAIIFAVALEALVMVLRKRPVLPAVSDYSAIVTGWLFALALPQLSPWWLTLTGIFFAIIVAKHLYGGLGYNPFNPAMVGYVILLISFPIHMTAWVHPPALSASGLSILDSLSIIFTGSHPVGLDWDALTEATPLDTVKNELLEHRTISEIWDNSSFGVFTATGWEWVANGFALGGFWLIYKRIIPWQLPLSLIGSIAVLSTIFYLSNPDHFAPPTFHIFSGAVMLGAFFIITDPVSGSTTPGGRIIFGLGVGLLTYIIRTWGGFPDAIAFSILLMNMAVPFIDHYTQPRVFGHKKNE